MSSQTDIILALPLALAETVASAVLAKLDVALARAKQEQQAQAERMAETQRLHNLVQASNVQTGEDANRAFMQHSLARLLEGTLEEPVRARCLALQRKFDQSTVPVTELLGEYTALLPLARSRTPVVPATGNAHLQQQADEIDALLASPLLSAATTDECRQHLADMRALTAGQPEVAAQGLDALQRRCERALQEAADNLHIRQQIAAQVRALLDQALPKLQVVSELSPLPVDRERATALRRELAETLAGDDDLPAVQRLAIEADALFAASQHALVGLATMQALSDQIAEVLQHLGYQVAQVTGEAMLTPVDESVGVEFHVNTAGRLETEMVALAPDTAADPAEEERVCSLVDEVIAGLHERNCAVREHVRRHCSGDHPLRVVSLPESAETPATMITTPISQQEELA